LYALGDFTAVGQEELQKLDMCLKRHLARTRSGWPLFRRKERMKSHASRGPHRLQRLNRVLRQRTPAIAHGTVMRHVTTRSIHTRLESASKVATIVRAIPRATGIRNAKSLAHMLCVSSGAG